MSTHYLIQSDDDDGYVFATRLPLFTVACTESDVAVMCDKLNSLNSTELLIRLADLGVSQETIDDLTNSSFGITYTAIPHLPAV
jgi:hypothetical protein